MNMRAATLFLSALTAVNAFVITSPSSHGRHCQVISQQRSRLVFLSSSSSDDDDDDDDYDSLDEQNNNNKNNNKKQERRLVSSRLEGNNRPASPEELIIMDEMIDKLADAKPYDLPNAVQRAFRVISSPQFFMRIAARADELASSSSSSSSSGDGSESNTVQQEKLAALAANLVSTLEAVVSTTEDRMDERAKDVENVIKAAAEPDSGEFMVPLLPERIAAMRSALQALDESALDTVFLNTIDAWMMKSHEDGMDLMVGILQKALQMYAGTSIMRAQKLANKTKQESSASSSSSSSSAAYQLFEQLLNTDADAWDAAITQGLSETEELTAKQLQTEIQRTMETNILSLEAGSMAQQVQAEFLQEMVKRVETYIK
jgi:hypothetical protein